MKWLRGLWRRRRAAKYFMLALIQWETGVSEALLAMSKSDPMLGDFHKNIDSAWRIIRFGRR